MHKRAWKRSKLYDDDHAAWTAQQKRYKAWKATDSPGKFWEWKGGEKKELTKAQKKAALQAPIDALG